ncbi:MAG TPA: endonuclease/exonuclease/phosphatase family protein [Vicinamibacterales bacterium]|nr:endonuclease/exonuclease/phosphatase family protein [Vicinamibacterales bacterium]
MPASRRRASRFVALLLLAPITPNASQERAREPLTVMTFNIRYGTADDGENRWSRRREMVFEVIRQQDPDVLGLQEALDAQIDEIIAALPDYAVVGVGRDDGRDGGEYSAILYRKSRLHVAEAGTFWLSSTPAVPGSASWGNRIPRICTWARFIDRDGHAFWHFNTHLDHESQPSRERSTLLIRERVEARTFREDPAIVTGDFNAGAKNPALATLIGAGAEPGSQPAPFVDTYRKVHPGEQDVGTYTAFTFGRTDGEKIDFVLAPQGSEILNADIIRWGRNNRYPSDHFPVVARVRLP